MDNLSKAHTSGLVFSRGGLLIKAWVSFQSAM